MRQKLRVGRFEYSLHAVRQMMARRITNDEIIQAILAGEVIEQYPDDKYGPSCLVFGIAASRRLHVHCTYPSWPLVKIITAYELNAAEWDETFRVRRR
ncbi:MAG TPA: DUF4258 domain-containing protein [Verrucomicrobiae bacterium]|nr:DUF4258 domain-containing protein [Verrucomicrobiae bacterium]